VFLRQSFVHGRRFLVSIVHSFNDEQTQMIIKPKPGHLVVFPKRSLHFCSSLFLHRRTYLSHSSLRAYCREWCCNEACVIIESNEFERYDYFVIRALFADGVFWFQTYDGFNVISDQQIK